MRVDHWIAPGMFAGAEQVVVGGAAALRRLGIDARVIVIREQRAPEHGDTFVARLEAADVPSIVIDATGRVDRALLSALFRQARTGSQLVHTHGIKATILSRLVLPRQVRHIATHHGVTSSDARTRMYERLLMAAYRRADAVVAVSPVTGELLARQGMPTRTLHVIENFLSRDPGSIGALRSAGHPVQLVFVGRLSIEKGLHVLLDAWAHTPCPESLALTVVGDGAERDALEETVRDRGLQSSVRFVGYVDDPSSYYRSADALVLPSYREGLPMTLLEALASGLPVLASRVGGIPEVLPVGAGELVTAGDVEAWSRVLASTPSSIDSWRGHAHEAADGIRERFSPDQWAERHHALYRLVAGGQR